MVKKTESLRKDIEAKKKSEIIQEMQMYSKSVSYKASMWKLAKIARRFVVSDALAAMKAFINEKRKDLTRSETPAQTPPPNHTVSVPLPKSIITSSPQHRQQPSIRFSETQKVGIVKQTGSREDQIRGLACNRAARTIQRFWEKRRFERFIISHGAGDLKDGVVTLGPAVGQSTRCTIQ